MFIVINNKSKGKSFRRTKRIISTVLPKVDLRLNMGEIPLRILEQLIENLRRNVTKGTKVKIFIATSSGFSGATLIEIGEKDKYLENFACSNKHFLFKNPKLNT